MPHRPAITLRKLLFASFLGACACLVQAQETGKELAEANRLFKQGKHAAALSSVDGHLTQNPTDAQGRFLKGLILTEQNRLEDATAVFVSLTNDFPELPEPYNNLAVLYAQQRHYDKARNALEMAIRTHPAYAIAYENLGDVYAKLASQAYGKALQIDSGNAVAQDKLSLIRELFGTTAKPPKAAATAPRVAAAQPAVVDARASAAAPAPVKLTVAEKPSSITKTSPPSSNSAATSTAKDPAVATPPSSTAAADSAGETLQAVTQTLEAWALAWSSKDFSSYLSHYEPDFSPNTSTSHKDWAVSRALRVGKPGDIDVAISDVRVALDDEGRAVARFHQRYQSDNLKSNTYKTMVLKRIGNRWLIVEERIG
ncbi:MAG TPA: tetratricopeptide repeat protein [Rhodocyclaceae bacterium]